ncbi:MAG: sn-glycerol-3-phosphate ABC transporter ATP-binding protein UgpC [Rhodobacteraceae bacterium]|nr:sn-glycerol-3-phosphate ABC transporter ATP-binding protein UgpC [Paracoccaceae bacterium]
MGAIKLSGVEKWFGDLQVMKGIDLEIPDGEFVVFVGPSGCGKSTLLRLIAGLEETSRGSIDIDGKDVTAELPSGRGLSMVFQSYALYPHMSVRDNVAFPLKTAGLPKSEINQKVEDAARVLKLDDYLDRRPKALSGGQRQRVAIGRAIVREPKAFLFDEPLSNLDAALRVEMRFEIARLHKALGTTMIYVTHDQVEAMTLADTIVVLRAGQIEQVGSPRTLYERPDNIFVAQFIGSPKMNVLPCKAEGAQFFLQEGKAEAYPHADKSQQLANLGIRPEHIEIVGKGEGQLDGEIEFAEYLGADSYLYIKVEGMETILVRMAGATPYGPGDIVGMKFAGEHTHFFDVDGKVIRSE